MPLKKYVLDKKYLSKSFETLVVYHRLQREKNHQWHIKIWKCYRHHLDRLNNYFHPIHSKSADFHKGQQTKMMAISSSLRRREKILCIRGFKSAEISSEWDYCLQYVHNMCVLYEVRFWPPKKHLSCTCNKICYQRGILIFLISYFQSFHSL